MRVIGWAGLCIWVLGCYPMEPPSGTGGGPGASGGGIAGTGGGVATGGGAPDDAGIGGADAGPMGSGETRAATLGPDGGTLTVGCHTLSVPAGALSASVLVTLTSTTQAAPTGYETYSPVLRIEPDSAVLARPASLSMCFAGNAQLATVFASQPQGGYERLGGLVSGTTITTPLRRFGDAFVANGVAYVDPPNRSCARLSLLEARTGISDAGLVLPDGGAGNLSSSVALMFRAEDCQGRPLVGLSETDFVVKENETALSVEANKTILPAKGLQVFATLVLDLSSSTRDDMALYGNVIAAAKAFVSQVQGGAVRVPISIRLFAGDATSLEWQAPTLDTATLLRRLDEVQTYSPADPASTNLYGAVIDAVARSTAVQADFRQRNAGGVFTAGYIVLFTDGADTTGLRTKAQAVMTATSSPDVFMAVALDTGDFSPAAREALNEITTGDQANGANVIVSRDPARLTVDFGAVANRMSGLSSGSYLLGYCSPKRAGRHTVAIELANATTQRRVEHSFDATRFTPGCSSGAFQAVCTNKECGGLGCGSCDDRVAACDGSTLRCVNACQASGRCMGEVFVNSQGYTQTCTAMPPSNASCGMACVDLNSSPAHCGACGNACAIGGSCASGSCGCPSGQADCNGTCRELNTVSNCGTCGNTCAIGATCTAGQCQCPPGQTVCNGACFASFDTKENCGTCGNTCVVECTAQRQCNGVAEVRAGGNFTCARLQDGTIRCWGANTTGQLGQGGGLTNSDFPVQVQGITTAIQLAVGVDHACALLQDTTVRCWGSNSSGQLGNGTTLNALVPVAVSGLTGVAQLSLGWVHTCAAMQDGTARCWGASTRGRLGIGSVGSSVVLTPTLVSGLVGVVQISAGVTHTCAVRQGHNVYCWGSNDWGELGLGSTTDQFVPALVSSASGASQIATSTRSGNTCARFLDGSVRCWGRNNFGQVGDGTTMTNVLVPTAVSGISSATQVEVGLEFACATLQDGTVRCWGNNSVEGRLNEPTVSASPTPLVVPRVTGAQQLTLGSLHACVRSQDSEVRCWGAGSAGQLGTNSLSPLRVEGLFSAQQVAATRQVAAGSGSTCALRADGTVACWGSVLGFQVQPTLPTRSDVPTTVPSLSSVVELVIFGNQSFGATACARLSDATVRCWGSGANGELGDGLRRHSLTPVAVSNLTGVSKLSKGPGRHVCAMQAQGLRCWGDNATGQLCNGSTTLVAQPGPITSGTFLDVAAGGNHTCAVQSNGQVVCCGSNTSAQLGNGPPSFGSTTQLTAVPGLDSAFTVVSGRLHSCAALRDGTVHCWGSNNQGQLGTTPGGTPSAPVRVAGVGSTVALAAGDQHTCALLTDGRVSCWGLNQYGQLGAPSVAGQVSSTPVLVPGLHGVVELSAGDSHTCARLETGELRCWGRNNQGQLTGMKVNWP